MDIKNIVKDLTLRSKYVLKTVYLAAGHAQIISRDSYQNLAELKSKTENGNALHEINHIHKIFTNNKVIAEMTDFNTGPKATALFSSIIKVPGYLLQSRDNDDNNIETEGEAELSKKATGLMNPVCLKLNLNVLPEDVAFARLINRTPNVIKQCWVVWDGCVFLAYSAESTEPDSFFGSRARRTLNSIFEDSDTLQCICIGPTPININMQILFISRESIDKLLIESKETNFIERPIRIANTVYIPAVVEASDDIDKAVSQFSKMIFHQIRTAFMSFYKAKIIATRLANKESQFKSTFSTIVDSLATLQNLSYCQFKDRYKLNKSLSTSSTKINVALIDEYRLNAELEEERRDTEKDCKENPISRQFREYFSEEMLPNRYIDRECVTNILTIVEKEQGWILEFNTGIMSAIVGGVMGLLGVLLGILLSK